MPQQVEEALQAATAATREAQALTEELRKELAAAQKEAQAAKQEAAEAKAKLKEKEGQTPIQDNSEPSKWPWDEDILWTNNLAERMLKKYYWKSSLSVDQQRSFLSWAKRAYLLQERKSRYERHCRENLLSNAPKLEGHFEMERNKFVSDMQRARWSQSEVLHTLKIVEDMCR